MLGWHALIGLGEAAITALTLGAVLASRPDLVYLLRDDSRRTRLVGERSRDLRAAAIGAGSVAMLLAGGLSFVASDRPDGLEYVAASLGFLDRAHEHALGDFVLADYGDVQGIPVGVVGVLGVLVTLALGWLVLRVLGGGAGGRRSAGIVIRQLPAHVKLLSVVAFMLVVVATPPERFWTFGAYALLLAVVAWQAGLRIGFVIRRMTIEIPFVVAALLMPFVSTGERIVVLGMAVSEDGLLSGWNLLAKVTLGAATAILLTATTDAAGLLYGLRRLRLPALMVEIAAFMVRYVDVILGELRRMRIARESRAFEARHLGHLRIVANGAGALFVRTYERAERVHHAMLARGYEGSMPMGATAPVPPAAWALAALLPLTALATALAGVTWT
jgi:cobalt/nickel transport system permease protein